MKKTMFKIFLLVCLVAFIVSVLHIVEYRYESVTENKQLEELQQKKVENPEMVETTEKHAVVKESVVEIAETLEDLSETQQESVLEILPEYQELYDENEDLIGWIKIEDMVINYPVMQTVDDPIFYNHMDWNKEYSKSGLPLIDARCTLNSENIIIYSHHMKDGSMFGSLKKYTNENFYNEHQIIEFDTIYEKAEYQIIAVLLAKAYYYTEPKVKDFVFYDYINMNEEQFEEYIYHIKNLSIYDTGVTAEYGDKLITLCTCYYHTQDGRLLVVAKKVQ